MLKRYFYKWVEYHISKINQRQFLINATIFRYKQLFRKTIKAIKQQRHTEYQTLLKQKVFKAFKTIIQNRQVILKQIKILKLKRYFEKMKSVAQGQIKDREVNNAIIECYNDKLLMKWFLKLRKASKILKKRKNNEKTIIKKKKQLYFDKWVIELQNYRLHLQLLQDSTVYYNEVLIKKAFKGWKRHMLDSKIYQTQLEQVCKIFKSWRNYTKEQNNKRNSKYQPIHNKWRKQTFFNYWKDATLDSQKDKLAKGFYMYKIFQSWKQYIEEIKQIQLKLQDKELILTVQIEKKRKKRYLIFWRRAYESKIEKKGLNKVMLQAKLKQRKLELLIQGFRSFKNNWKLNKYQQYKRIKFVQMIFYSIKYFTDLSKMKMEQLINYQNKKRLQQLSKVFNSLKYDYDLIKQKDEKAQNYYNSIYKIIFRKIIKRLLSVVYKRSNKIILKGVEIKFPILHLKKNYLYIWCFEITLGILKENKNEQEKVREIFRNQAIQTVKELIQKNESISYKFEKRKEKV